MNDYIVTIDGGTSNTRLRLLHDRTIVESVTLPLGAASIASGKTHEQFKQSLKQVIDRIMASHDGQIICFLCSGMITSNIGLFYLPHLQGPVDLRKTTIAPLFFKEIHPAPFYLIPGLKFGNCITDFSCSDLIKGEETEVLGILSSRDYEKSYLIIHFGTHHKAMVVRDGVIVSSISTMGGELLEAIMANTILKNSVCSFSDLVLKESAVLSGYQHAKQAGFSRCLFLGRIGSVLYDKGDMETLSFLYGAILQSDLQGFSSLLSTCYDGVILYGREDASTACHYCLQQDYPHLSDKLEQIGHQESELLSTKGLYEFHLHQNEKGR